MAKRKQESLLPGTRILTRYAEAESYFQDFARGTYQFIWLTGRSGVGKSESIKAALAGTPVLHFRFPRNSRIS
jgi:hypothetical protein